MERILVAGGTGVAGREVVEAALQRGHEVRVLSRHIPSAGHPAFHPDAEYVRADVTTREGLSPALAGVDVVIDTLDGKTGKARTSLAAGAENLTTAAVTAGVGRVVLLSIVNVDQGPLAYYRAKAEQERAYTESAAKTVIVRATQFHELVAGIVGAAAKARMFLSARGIAFQPIAVGDVAEALVDAATAAEMPPAGRTTVGGPEVLSMHALAEICRDAGGGKGKIITVPLPGSNGRFFREGRNLVPDNTFGTLTFSQWLQLQPR